MKYLNITCLGNIAKDNKAQVMYQLLFTKEKLDTLKQLSSIAVPCIDEEIARQHRRKCNEIIRELPIDALLWARGQVTGVSSEIPRDPVSDAPGGRAVLCKENQDYTPPTRDTHQLNLTKSLGVSDEFAKASKEVVSAAIASFEPKKPAKQLGKLTTTQTKSK